MSGVKVASSNLDEVEYDEAVCRLTVSFKNGSAYAYANVPKSVYEQMLKADSVGSYLAKHIRDKYASVKVRGATPAAAGLTAPEFFAGLKQHFGITQGANSFLSAESVGGLPRLNLQRFTEWLDAQAVPGVDVVQRVRDRWGEPASVFISKVLHVA